MNTISVKGTGRADLGKKANKAIRREGGIPAVMYGGEETVHFVVTFNDVKGLIYTPDFNVAEVEIDGKMHRCILKEVQFHPVTEGIIHMDFIELIDGKPVNVELPIRFKGSSPGVKLGGKLQQNLRRVKVKVVPEHLVDELFVDVSELELGHSVRVRDIELNDNIELMVSPSIPVASVETPRALRSAEAAAEGEEVEGEERR